MKFTLLLLTAFCLNTVDLAHAADAQPAATAVNALGVDLYHGEARGEGNLLLSPYSIQVALVMTFAGADGKTRSEMQRVLHYPADEAVLDGSFGALMDELNDAAAKSVEAVEASKETQRGPRAPIEFHLANRLFPQKGLSLRPEFLERVKAHYGGPVEEVDYAKDPDGARKIINDWVTGQTKDRIHNLIPPDALQPSAVLTLVNALYLRAPWQTPFSAYQTQPDRFLVHGHEAVNVPMMIQESACGYLKRNGYQVVALPYDGGQLQFVILLADEPAKLNTVEKRLTPALLAELAHLPTSEIILRLPKFRFEPPTVDLVKSLKALGMVSAFSPSADFGRMVSAPARGLWVSNVFHKTFLDLDEKGTEAAAATAVVMTKGGGGAVAAVVKVDHPFVFAIQHVPSGACLFLGRVTDPR